MRSRPPQRRLTDRTEVSWNRSKVYLDVGRYPDGRACEIFIDANKEGSDIKDIMGALGIAVSLGLQRGVTAAEFKESLRGFPMDSLPTHMANALAEPSPYRHENEMTLEEINRQYEAGEISRSMAMMLREALYRANTTPREEAK